MAFSQDSYENLGMPGTQAGHQWGVQLGDEFSSTQVEEPLVSLNAYLQHGVVLASGQGVLRAGTVVGRRTSDNKYLAYASGHSDGTQTPIGFLRRTVDTTNGDVLANVLVRAEVRYDLAYSGGLDANAITALVGRVAYDGGLKVFIF